jgi:hypothetical protein
MDYPESPYSPQGGVRKFRIKTKKPCSHPSGGYEAPRRLALADQREKSARDWHHPFTVLMQARYPHTGFGPEPSLRRNSNTRWDLNSPGIELRLSRG